MGLFERLEEEKAVFESLIASTEREGERCAKNLSYVDLIRVITFINEPAAEKPDDTHEKLYRFYETIRFEKLSEAEKKNTVNRDILKELEELAKVSSYQEARSKYLKDWYNGFLKGLSPIADWLKQGGIFLVRA